MTSSSARALSEIEAGACGQAKSTLDADFAPASMRASSGLAALIQLNTEADKAAGRCVVQGQRLRRATALLQTGWSLSPR